MTAFPDPRHSDRVDPVPPGLPQPFWSVMIPAYNCGSYLEQTLRSVLAQDPGLERMQIEVIDDASTDRDLEKLVSDVGAGRIAYFRQSRNVGHIANFHTALQRSRGQVIHLLHGDDMVEPGFYAALEPAFEDETIGAAFCASRFMDENGGDTGTTVDDELRLAGPVADRLDWLASEQRIMTPSIVVRRSVYEVLGGFDRRIKTAEDWEMWVRIAAHYSIWYDPRPLARYRIHSQSHTGRHARSGEDLASSRMAIDIFSKYLPADERHRITRRARSAYSQSGLRAARRFIREGDGAAARAQVREVVKLRATPAVLWSALRLTLKSVFAKHR